MKPFDIASIDDLAKLLRVHPHEIASVCHDRDRLYSTFRKRKGTSGIRTLNVPQGRLKLLQEKIHSHIFGVVKPLSCVHGGVARRSAITNARQHIKKEVVFCLDIADFFPSIDAALNVSLGRSVLGERRLVLWSASQSGRISCPKARQPVQG